MLCFLHVRLCVVSCAPVYIVVDVFRFVLSVQLYVSHLFVPVSVCLGVWEIVRLRVRFVGDCTRVYTYSFTLSVCVSFAYAFTYLRTLLYVYMHDFTHALLSICTCRCVCIYMHAELHASISIMYEYTPYYVGVTAVDIDTVRSCMNNNT